MGRPGFAGAETDKIGGSMIRVASLHIYPLKSGRGIDVEQVAIGPFGPEDDRRWMVVDQDGALVTQREIARLCQISAVPSPESVTLTAPGSPVLVVPRPPRGAPTRTVRVWNDHPPAVDLGPEAAAWCTGFLGADVRLVYIPDDAERRTDPGYDPVGARVSFADGYPLLVIGQASLAELNSRLATPLPMNRFRPNLVTSGSEPFAEDTWRAFSIGEIPFEGLKLCARCVITATDQETGVRAKEPLTTLAKFRKQGSGVMFGMNVVHRKTGVVRVGDPVRIDRVA